MADITPDQQKRIDEIKREIHKILETHAKAESAIDDLKKLWEEIKAIQDQGQSSSTDSEKQIKTEGL